MAGNIVALPGISRQRTPHGVVHLVRTGQFRPLCDPRGTRVVAQLQRTDDPVTCGTCTFLERHQEQLLCSACGHLEISTQPVGRVVNDKPVRLCARCRAHGGLLSR